MKALLSKALPSSSRDGDGTPHRAYASAWMLGTGLLFLICYGASNQYSAGLAHVPSLYLPWETAIPFIPWSVVPYWSLDLLFIVSFYGLASRAELHRHAARILFALLVSVGGFLLYPLHFAFSRPETQGIPGLLFDALAVDLPYNQLPSLHISLALIYWPVIRRMLPNGLRGIAAVWFVLIGLSTLTTYQHHAIDLAGGLLVGLLSMHLIPLTPAPRRPVNRRMTVIGLRYLAAAVSLAGIAALAKGWTLLLLYPLVGLALVGAAYIAGRGNFLHKTDGRHCGVVWLLFAPFLLGQRLSAWYFNRGRQPWQVLIPGIAFGRRLSDAQARRLIREQEIGAVLDLSGELPGSPLLRRLDYRNLPWHDLVVPTGKQLREAVDWVLSRQAPVYIHCSLGLGRSVAVAESLLRTAGHTEREARERIQSVQPSAVFGAAGGACE